MGGTAFSNPAGDPSAPPPLLTPRMPPPVYEQTRDRVLAILRTFYTHVACPIEAPEKPDHGDIDILVCEPREKHVEKSNNVVAVSEKELVECLGAVAVKRDGGGSDMVQFAIPWPVAGREGEEGALEADLLLPSVSSTPTRVDMDGGAAAATNALIEGGHDTALFYIQLDLHILPNLDLFKWKLFHSSHGDLWPILGAVIRPFGLSPKPTGLYLRIADIENHKRRRSAIKLTASPSKALEFLGLDASTYWTRFGSSDEMFQYIATSRFYGPWRQRLLHSEGEEKEPVGLETETGAEGPPLGKADMKVNAKDRSRHRKRAVYAQWIREHEENGSTSTLVAKIAFGGAAGEQTHMITRDEIVEEAKRVFGIGEHYDETRKTCLRQIGEEKMWAEIRKDLLPMLAVDAPEEGGVRLGIVIRGVKRILTAAAASVTAMPPSPLFDPGEMVTVVVTPTTTYSGEQHPPDLTTVAAAAAGEATAEEDQSRWQHQLRTDFTDGHFDRVADAVRVHWEEIEEAQKLHDRERSSAHLRAKMQRDKLKMEGEGEGAKRGIAEQVSNEVRSCE